MVDLSMANCEKYPEGFWGSFFEWLKTPFAENDGFPDAVFEWLKTPFAENDGFPDAWLRPFGCFMGPWDN